MGLISGRLIVVVVIFCLLIGWAMAVGDIRWQADSYKCLNGRRPIATVPKQRLWAVGSLNFYYQPLSYTCPNDEQFDPKIYKVVDGQIQSLANPGPVLAPTSP